MPKTEIDYSNTIIYKITCKDSNVNDVYVGHTTNFVQRKHAHKQSCINDKSTNYKCKLYETIRNNGGWNNWNMEIINFFNCNDHYEARKKEYEYFVLLNATLNSIEPMPKPKFKPIQNEIINKEKDYSMEIACEKSLKFVCNKCDYKCSKQSQWERHVNTRKHKNIDILLTNVDILGPKKVHMCYCGKNYSHRQSLSIHKKKCNKYKIDKNIENPDKKYELINYLIK